MDLFSKNNIRNLLKQHNARPIKRLGQNFLIDKNIVKKIITSAALKPDDIVLEIGAGLGAITKELAQKVKKVIAVEKDPQMCEILQQTLKRVKNVRIINDDILKLKLGFKFQVPPSGESASRPAGFKIIGNLPFYLTSPVIRKFLEIKNPPSEITLIIQKEVSQRICAKPPKMNFLAVCVQFFAEPKIISYISKNSFWPQPEVDAAIIRITPNLGKARPCHTSLFFKIASAGFSQPRKQLANNLSKKLKLDKEKVQTWLFENNIKPTQRAESLTINNWLKLTRTYNKYRG